jgi:hypothetical protein
VTEKFNHNYLLKESLSVDLLNPDFFAKGHQFSKRPYAVILKEQAPL